MIPASETFGGTYPFKPNFSTSAGFKAHYLDEGSGDVIVCLHGEPSWSYLYRHVIPLLSERYRVIAPDYMGFGKSETPQNKEYTLQTHVDNLEILLLELKVDNITLVLHDWGGSVGTGFALRHPDLIKRIIVMNTTIMVGLPYEAELLQKALEEADYFKWMRKWYTAGNFELIFQNFELFILSVMKKLQGFENSRNIDDNWMNAYGSHFKNPEDCKGVIAFPKSAITGEGGSLNFVTEAAIEELKQKPAIMIYGMKDKVLLPQYFIPIFERFFTKGNVFKLHNAGHFLQEDEPVAIAGLIDQFIRLS